MGQLVTTDLPIGTTPSAATNCAHMEPPFGKADSCRCARSGTRATLTASKWASSNCTGRTATKRKRVDAVIKRRNTLASFRRMARVCVKGLGAGFGDPGSVVGKPAVDLTRGSTQSANCSFLMLSALPCTTAANRIFGKILKASDFLPKPPTACISAGGV